MKTLIIKIYYKTQINLPVFKQFNHIYIIQTLKILKIYIDNEDNNKLNTLK